MGVGPRQNLDEPLVTSVKAYSVSPAPTIRCCRPSSIHVDGPLLTPRGRRKCQRTLPSAGSYTTRLDPDPPVTSSLPAVVRMPEFPAAPPPPRSLYSWDHLMLPVLTSIASSTGCDHNPPPPPAYPSGLSEVSYRYPML